MKLVDGASPLRLGRCPKCAKLFVYDPKVHKETVNCHCGATHKNGFGDQVVPSVWIEKD